MRRVLVPILLLTLAGLAPAQEPGPFRGKAPKTKPDPRAIGALGGEGIALVGDAAEQVGLHSSTAGIRITSLITHGAGASGGLKVGDIIIGIGRRPLRSEESPFLQLTRLVEQPRREREPVEVRIIRDGEAKKIEVFVPGTARHSRTCPKDCPRCQKILEESLRTLAEMQTKSGAFPTQLGGVNGQVAVTSIAGLAFLAAGSTPTEGPYAENLRRATAWLVSHAGTENTRMTRMTGKNWSQVNWALGYAPLFLTRVYALQPTDGLRKKLVALRDGLIKNMEPSGGWAHGPRCDLPYPLGYAELVAVCNPCLASLGEIDSVGIRVPAERIAKAMSYIEESADGSGGVGYSTRPGQKGIGSVGRTAGALFAMYRCGLERHPFTKRLTAYFRHNLAELPHCHVSPDFHFFFGALAARALGERDWSQFMETFRTEFLSLWNGDGTFGVRPADTSEFGMPNTDRTMGPAWRTATVAMILALGDGRLDRRAGDTDRK